MFKQRRDFIALILRWELKKTMGAVVVLERSEVSGKMLITLNEDEDDVKRGKFDNLEVLISPLGRSSGL